MYRNNFGWPAGFIDVVLCKEDIVIIKTDRHESISFQISYLKLHIVFHLLRNECSDRFSEKTILWSASDHEQETDSNFWIKYSTAAVGSTLQSS